MIRSKSFRVKTQTEIVYERHRSIVRLILAYTLALAVVFTVVVTCLSLVGIVHFVDPRQQGKLFALLIVEVAVIGIAVFKGFLQVPALYATTGQNVKSSEESDILLSVIERFHNATKFEEIEELADEIGRMASRYRKAAVDALLSRLGDPVVQEDPDVEDAVCTALARLGVMRRKGNLNFVLLSPGSLHGGIRNLLEKHEIYIPRRYCARVHGNVR